MKDRISSVEIRDAREMIASEGVEIYLDMTYDTGREVSVGLSEAAVDDLEQALEEVRNE